MRALEVRILEELRRQQAATPAELAQKLHARKLSPIVRGLHNLQAAEEVELDPGGTIGRWRLRVDHEA